MTIGEPSKLKKMPCAWYDDPIFDHEGEEWRRLQRLKEAGMQIVKVAGTTFRREGVKAAIHKTDVAIIPEPNNPHDSNALRVEVGGFHVGYIPRNCNKPISPESISLFKSGLEPQPHVWLACAV